MRASFNEIPIYNMKGSTDTQARRTEFVGFKLTTAELVALQREALKHSRNLSQTIRLRLFGRQG
jgi:hypothetical protein